MSVFKSLVERSPDLRHVAARSVHRWLLKQQEETGVNFMSEFDAYIDVARDEVEEAAAKRRRMESEETEQRENEFDVIAHAEADEWSDWEEVDGEEQKKKKKP